MHYYGLQIDYNLVRLFDDTELIDQQPSLVALDVNQKMFAYGQDAKELVGQMTIQNILDSQEALFFFIDQLFNDHKIFGLFKKVSIFFNQNYKMDDQLCLNIQTHLLSKGAIRVIYDTDSYLAILGTNVSITSKIHTCFLHLESFGIRLSIYQNNSLVLQKANAFGYRSTTEYIRRWMRHHTNLEISDATLEQILSTIATSTTSTFPQSVEIRGFDTSSQKTKVMYVNENQIAQMIQPIISQWANWIYQTVTSLPEIAISEITTRGIICTGEFGTIKNINKSLQKKLNIPFYVASNPEYSVMYGIQSIFKQGEV